MALTTCIWNSVLLYKRTVLKDSINLSLQVDLG